ncbi:MAG: peptidoglycan editing factor PgeF, partial [Gallionella sp.]
MNPLEHCIIPDWPAPKQVRALQTTRQGGVSVAPYDSLNLGGHVGDNPLAVERNRMLLNRLLPGEPVWLEQIHGTRVANADQAGCRVQADACIARHRAAVCVVMTADCLPILLCDTQGSVVGAAHAGWKGLAAGVIETTVLAMGVAPQHLMAWLGPAISQEAFEVGEEVRAAFVGAQPQSASAFTPGQPGKWFAD